MIGITKIDHLGIRVRDRHRAVAFYGDLGFALVADAGFDEGHPIIMRHPSGVVLNILGPTSEERDENVLMDIDPKYAGYTHLALEVDSLAEAKAFLADKGIEITGGFSFKTMTAIFIRDPDRNVIELDEYSGDDPASSLDPSTDNTAPYDAHP